MSIGKTLGNALNPLPLMGTLCAPLKSLRRTNNQNQNVVAMSNFLGLTTRATLAGVAIFAFSKLVEFSPRKAVAAAALGSVISLPTTLIGAAGLAMYKGVPSLVSAARDRSLPAAAASFALALGGWVVLNNRQKIVEVLCGNDAKLRGFADGYINQFANYAGTAIGSLLPVKPPKGKGQE